MAVWSVSQNKFIDAAQPGPTAAAPAAGGGASSVAQMKQLYAMEILKRAKKPADIVTAFSLLEPSAAEVKAMDKTKELDTEKNNKLRDIDTALSILQGKSGKKVKTNPIAGIAMKIKSLWGGGSPQEKDLYRLLSELGGEKMFSIGGKALTAPERAILAPIIPSASYGNDTNIGNLNSMRNKISGLYDAYDPQAETSVTDNAYGNYDTGDFIPE